MYTRRGLLKGALAAGVTLPLLGETNVLDLSGSGLWLPSKKFRYPLAPAPPRTYSIPGGSISVSTGAALATELAGGSQKDIVLEDGTYANGSTYFTNNGGHRIRARNLHGAVLESGFQGNAGAGPLYQGLYWNITDVNKTLNASAFHVWGAMTDIQVLDCRINGNAVLQQGIWINNKTALSNLKIQRALVQNGVDTGLRLHHNVQADYVATPMLLEDLNISGWKHATPGTLNGTGESGLTVGNRATIRRIKIRDCGWMGLCPIDSADSLLVEHFDIDDIKSNSSGIYPEHKTSNSLFRYGYIGVRENKVLKGVTLEWHANSGTGSTHGCTFKDMVIQSHRVGFYSDDDNGDNTLDTIRFYGQCWAAVGDYLPEAPGLTRINLDTSGIDGGAVAYTNGHINDALGCGSLP